MFAGTRVIALALLVLAAGGGFADPAKDGKTEKQKSVDRALDKAILKVNNHGAEVFNHGDPLGCVRIYEGALITARPLLAHRPRLQRAIDDALARGQDRCKPRTRAFALRSVLDRIRSEVSGKAGKDAKDAKKGKPQTPKKAVPAPGPGKTQDRDPKDAPHAGYTALSGDKVGTFYLDGRRGGSHYVTTRDGKWIMLRGNLAYRGEDSDGNYHHYVEKEAGGLHWFFPKNPDDGLQWWVYTRKGGVDTRFGIASRYDTSVPTKEKDE